MHYTYGYLGHLEYHIHKIPDFHIPPHTGARVLSFCFGGRRCALVFVLDSIPPGDSMSTEHGNGQIKILLTENRSVQQD